MRITSSHRYLVLASATLLSSSVWASQPQGWYGEIAGGISMVDINSEVHHQGTNSNGAARYDLDNDHVVGLGVGYRFDNGIALQLDYRQRDYDTDAGYRNGSGARAAQRYSLAADVESETLTLSVLYPLQTIAGFEPYLKGGVGYGKNSFTAQLDIRPQFDALDPTGNARWTYQKDDTGNLVWQVGAGARYAFSEQLSVNGEVQYIDLGRAYSQWDTFGDRGYVDDFSSVELTLGLQYQF